MSRVLCCADSFLFPLRMCWARALCAFFSWSSHSHSRPTSLLVHKTRRTRLDASHRTSYRMWRCVAEELEDGVWWWFGAHHSILCHTRDATHTNTPQYTHIISCIIVVGCLGVHVMFGSVCAHTHTHRPLTSIFSCVVLCVCLGI